MGRDREKIRTAEIRQQGCFLRRTKDNWCSKAGRLVVAIQGLSEKKHTYTVGWRQAKLQRLPWSSGCGNKKRPLCFNWAASYRPISISQNSVWLGQNMLTSSCLGCKEAPPPHHHHQKLFVAVLWNSGRSAVLRRPSSAGKNPDPAQSNQLSQAGESQ